MYDGLRTYGGFRDWDFRKKGKTFRKIYSGVRSPYFKTRDDINLSFREIFVMSLHFILQWMPSEMTQWICIQFVFIFLQSWLVSCKKENSSVCMEDMLVNFYEELNTCIIIEAVYWLFHCFVDRWRNRLLHVQLWGIPPMSVEHHLTGEFYWRHNEMVRAEHQELFLWINTHVVSMRWLLKQYRYLFIHCQFTENKRWYCWSNLFHHRAT